MNDDPQENLRGPVRGWEWWLLGAAVVLGAVVRFWAAWRAPGFWYDEAIYALDSLDVWRNPGYWPIFFDREDHMREPLYMYFQALVLGIFGVSVEVFRGGSAAIGTLTIPTIWLLAREWRGRIFAAIAVAVFVTMRWHVHFSGLGFRTITAPLFSALTMLFLLRYLRLCRWQDAVACGAALGVGLYTYLAFRLMPIVVMVPLLAAVIGTLWRRDAFRPLAFGISLIVGTSALVFLPLGVHYLRNPQHFSGRSNEVTLTQRPDAANIIMKQARDVALMPLVRGDHVGKHNLPGPPRFLQLIDTDPEIVAEVWSAERETASLEIPPREPMDPHGTGVPVFGLPGGVLFYAGLLLALGAALRGDTGALAILSLLVIGSLSSVLSFGAPNMLRLTLIIPAACCLVALAMEELRNRVASAAFLTTPSSRRIASVVVIVNLLLPMAWRDYQRQAAWPTHPMVPFEFNAELADIGRFLAAQPDRLPVLLPFAEQPTLTFIADGTIFNPLPIGLGARWWEMRCVPPFPPLRTFGEPIPGGRRLQIIHPQGIPFGELVEVGR